MASRGFSKTNCVCSCVLADCSSLNAKYWKVDKSIVNDADDGGYLRISEYGSATHFLIPTRKGRFRMQNTAQSAHGRLNVETSESLSGRVCASEYIDLADEAPMPPIHQSLRCTRLAIWSSVRDHSESISGAVTLCRPHRQKAML